MLGRCKYGSTAILELRTNHTFEKSLVTFIPENSVFIYVPEQDYMYKKAKVPRINQSESAILDMIIEQLRKQYQDTTSVFPESIPSPTLSISKLVVHVCVLMGIHTKQTTSL